MANPEHLAELTKGVESWNQWRASNRLSHPDLSGADFVGANLIGANLRGANLRGANLRGAKLTDGNLTYADLSHADLTDTDVHYARCTFTTWANVNLLETIGLSKVRHQGASTVGTDTLVLSKGKIPPEFLKGCGLADWEIENAKLYDPDLSDGALSEIHYRVFELRMRGPIQISPVFISYTHADAEFVDKLGSQLDAKGVRYWRDIKDATAGRLDKVIERGISLNPTLLLVLSQQAIESDWVQYEIDKAVQLSKKLKRDVLCPIALDKAWLESNRMSENLQTQIKKYNVLDFGAYDDDKVFASQFRKLLDGLGLHYRTPAEGVAEVPNRP